MKVCTNVVTCTHGQPQTNNSHCFFNPLQPKLVNCPSTYICKLYILSVSKQNTRLTIFPFLSVIRSRPSIKDISKRPLTY